MARAKKITTLFIAFVVAVCLGGSAIHLKDTNAFASSYDGFTDVNDEVALTTSLEGTSNVRLTKDITTTNTINVTRQLTLDLNGYTLNYKGQAASPVIEIEENGDLTVVDNSSKVSEHFLNTKYEYEADLVKESASASVTGGLITGGTSSGIKVMQGGSLYLSGGNVAGNSGIVGGIEDNGSVTLSGGQVCYNTSTATDGAGGVYVGEDGSLKVCSSPKVINNHIGTDDSNVVLADNKQVEVSGALTEGACLSLTASHPAQSPVGVNCDISSDEIVKYLKTDSINKQEMTAYREVVAPDGTISWKSVVLVDKPQDEEVTYNGQEQVPTAISSLGGGVMTVAANNTYKNADNYKVEVDINPAEAMWSDGDTGASYTFNFTIDKLVIDSPQLPQTTFEYSGEEIKLDIAESDYYTISGAVETDAGVYEAKLTLTDSANTRWATTDSDTITISYEIIGQITLLWLVLLLALVLIEELIVSRVYWRKRSKRYATSHEEVKAHVPEEETGINASDYIKEYHSNYNDNNMGGINSFSVAPIGLGLLAATVPMWEIVSIVLLSAAIIIVALYNIVRTFKENKMEAEAENGEELVPDGVDRRFYDAISPSSDTYITFVPPASPVPFRGASVSVPEGHELSVHKIAVEGCGEISNPNPAKKQSGARQEKQASEQVTPPADCMEDDVDEISAEEIPSEITRVDGQMLAVRDDDGEVLEVLHGIDYSTDTAYVKRYRRSFTARLIQSWDSSKYYYSILKNEALSYAGTKSVVSWDYDCVSVELMPAVKFDIRGKTLCIYLPLNPDDYKSLKYGVEHTTLKKYDDEPCLLRIKDENCIEYAKKLISDIMTKYGAKQGKVMQRNFDKPYEPIQPLVEKGLAKEYLAKEKYSDFLKRSDKVKQNDNKASGYETAEKEETKPLIDLDEEDIEEVHLIDKVSGKEIIKRYNKSFTAKLIQSTDETKSYYATLKNEILSYESTKSTIWWNCDSIHTSNRTIARFGIQDGVLCLYLALKPSDYIKTYPVETANGKRYAHVPCMFRVKNLKRRKDAISLIAHLAEKCGLQRGTTQNEDYYCAYESTETLISKGLIKEVGSREGVEEKKCESRKTVKKNTKNRISAQDADKLLTNEQAMALVQDGRSGKRRVGKKAEVNIDAIASTFNAGDVVNIEKLQQKGIVPSDAVYVKILAHGELDKKLTVEAQDFEICAVKMILLTGGTARKI